MLDDDDTLDDGCPLLPYEDRPNSTRREYLARVRLIVGPPAIVITTHVVMGPYVMSAEHPLDDLTLAEARQLHDALGEAIAAYEVRTLAALDTEPEPMIESDIPRKVDQ